MFLKKAPMVFNISTKILGNDLQLSEYAKVEPFLGCKKDRFLGRKMLKSALLSCLCIQTLAPPHTLAANPMDIDLANLSSQQGFSIVGGNSGDRSGFSVSGAGDVNKDGYDDFIIGAPYGHRLSWGGRSYVIYGEANLDNIDLLNLSLSQGFFIEGGRFGDDLSGRSVSAAGDLNKDGYADVIIGAPQANAGKYMAGESYVVYGGANLTNLDLLANLPASRVRSLYGIAKDDQSGCSVSGIGDVNKDGYDDFIIGAYFSYPGGSRPLAGQSYVIYGGSNFPQSLASLSSSQGFFVNGASMGDESGYSVSGAGDVNNDGYADFIIGARWASRNGRSNAGQSYVIYGGVSLSSIDLANLAPSRGFTISGAAEGDNSGVSVSNAGDVNKDGYADIIIGAPGADPSGRSGAGVSYVIYGGASLTNLDLSNLSSLRGFSISGAAEGDNSGVSVSNAGDVNRDGYADIIIGAPDADPSGRSGAGVSYVVYGGASLANLELASLSSLRGFTIAGAAGHDRSGYSVSGAGDVDKDGYSDVIVGAYFASPVGRSAAGASYLVYGGATSSPTTMSTTVATTSTLTASTTTRSPTTSPSPASTSTTTSPEITNLDLSNLSVIQGFSIFGAASRDWAGHAVSNAGDINNDGYADFLVAAVGASPNGRANAGKTYLIYGGDNLGAIELTNLPSTRGFSISGVAANDQSGYSLSSAGDVNKDGYPDFLIGAATASPNGRSFAGQSYVVYGGVDLTNIDLAHLSPARGFTISGAEGMAGSVGGAGDVNGDGYADLIVGAPSFTASGRLGSGRAYIIYGGPGLSDVDLSNFSSSQGMTISGALANDGVGGSVSGTDINGDGYSDLVTGASKASSHGKANAGKTYVIYGGRGLTNIDLASFTSSQGFFIGGASEGDSSGQVVREAGDVNKDGYPDIVIGAPDADPSARTNAGAIYVIYGGPNHSNIDLADLPSSKGFSIMGATANDYSGNSVSGAGDVNKDGYDDVLIGAIEASPEGKLGGGKSYVVFGGAAPSNVDLATLSLTEGFYIAGAVAGDASGSAVSNAGDVNQDGYTDLLIGAVTASSNGRIQAGQAYLIYGGGGARIVPTTTHLPSDPDVSSSTTYQSWLAPVIGGVLGGIAIMTTAFLLAKKFFRPNWVVPAPDDAGGPGMQGVEA